MIKPDNKERLDQLLFEKGLYESRSKAQAAIMAGVVYVNEKKIEKAGIRVGRDSRFEIRDPRNSYASRGGIKLEHALNTFDIDVKDKTILDVGASTGGFTDCLLKAGAGKVYAIDVGYGQIAWKLRKDPRVEVIERTNVRYLKPEELYSVRGKREEVGGEKASLATIDVSFISLSKILPAVYDLLTDDGEVIALVKPQFEAGREQVGKGGLVKDEKVQARVLTDVVKFAGEIGFKLRGATFSPISGADGNIEFFVYLSKLGENVKLDAVKIVEEAKSLLSP